MPLHHLKVPDNIQYRISLKERLMEQIAYLIKKVAEITLSVT
jgi:hypothetical protein